MGRTFGRLPKHLRPSFASPLYREQSLPNGRVFVARRRSEPFGVVLFFRGSEEIIELIFKHAAFAPQAAEAKQPSAARF